MVRAASATVRVIGPMCERLHAPLGGCHGMRAYEGLKAAVAAREAGSRQEAPGLPRARSADFASRRAWSALISTNALRRGLILSMRASSASTISTGETFFRRISAACSVADSQFRSVGGIDGLQVGDKSGRGTRLLQALYLTWGTPSASPKPPRSRSR